MEGLGRNPYYFVTLCLTANDCFHSSGLGQKLRFVVSYNPTYSCRSGTHSGGLRTDFEVGLLRGRFKQPDQHPSSLCA